MKRFLIAAAAVCSLAAPAGADQIMPSFDGAPSGGWVTDRYLPNVFEDVGDYEGRSYVLAIGISEAEGLTNRPAVYQSTFYNTQGMQHAVTGGTGDVLSADLWIPEEWNTATFTYRTDMWGVMTGVEGVTDYPIIGVTNFGGAPRFRVWDSGTGVWIDLDAPVMFGEWNDLAVQFTGTSFNYFVNGQMVITDPAHKDARNFSAVIMQAYNFHGDTSLSASPAPYTAHWANSVAPEPVPDAGSTLALLALGLLGAGVVRRRLA